MWIYLAFIFSTKNSMSRFLIIKFVHLNTKQIILIDFNLLNLFIAWRCLLKSYLCPDKLNFACYYNKMIMLFTLFVIIFDYMLFNLFFPVYEYILVQQNHYKVKKSLASISNRFFFHISNFLVLLQILFSYFSLFLLLLKFNLR